MTPPTDEQLEQQIRAAADAGDTATIDRLGALLDERDAARPTPALLASALWYAEQGIPVFALQALSKVPMRGSSGCKDATTDADRIRAWWAQTPDANIGLATGHTVDVVDIDGLVGQTSRAHQWGMFTGLNVIGKVSTPRAGGLHLFVPASGQGNKAGLLPGVDYRGTGGYVVAAPSRTDVGAYRWTVPLDVAALRDAA